MNLSAVVITYNRIDVVDAVKRWEDQHGGAREFVRICGALNREYDERENR